MFLMKSKKVTYIFFLILNLSFIPYLIKTLFSHVYFNRLVDQNWGL